MKDKKAVQEKQRRRHRERLREQRGKAPILERCTPYKEEKPSILIVCEGELTEPSYFEKFRVPSATIEIVGKGYNTVSLVNEAMRLYKSSNAEYDQVWCVFDKDDFSPLSSNTANSCRVL